jgi:hypothetical protein
MRVLTSLSSFAVAGLWVGCMPALSARPARVHPGVTIDVRQALAWRSPSRGSCLGPSTDLLCDYPLLMATEIGAVYGTPAPDAARARSVGAGVDVSRAPYVELYQQLGTVGRPWGIGVRGGGSVYGWSAHQLEVRGERVLTARQSVVWNTALVAQIGSRPDQTHGTVLTLAHSRGVIHRSRFLTTTSSLVVGVQRADGVAPEARFTSPLKRFEPAWGVVAGIGGSVIFHWR